MPIIAPAVTTETTFADMVTEVLANLQGYVRDQEAATALSSDITPTTLTLSVGSTANASSGIVEIDDELLWVDSYDQASNTLTVAPYGRGFQGTTASSHSATTRVNYNPRFPRWRVKRAINDTIQAAGSQVYAVAASNITYQSVVASYELPAGTNVVREVSWQTLGPTRSWQTIIDYDVDLHADTTAFPSGKSITLLTPVIPGQTVRVIVNKAPGTLSLDADVFSTVTGWDTSMYDVIVYGACARLVSFIDVAHLDFKSVEAEQFNQANPAGAGAAVSRYFEQMYLMRLREERGRQQTNHRPTLRRSR